jgi:hypothetical protein
MGWNLTASMPFGNKSALQRLSSNKQNSVEIGACVWNIIEINCAIYLHKNLYRVEE